jgi:hypothetical protein
MVVKHEDVGKGKEGRQASTLPFVPYHTIPYRSRVQSIQYAEMIVNNDSNDDDDDDYGDDNDNDRKGGNYQIYYKINPWAKSKSIDYAPDWPRPSKPSIEKKGEPRVALCSALLTLKPFYASI